jgi:hypothetical protein
MLFLIYLFIDFVAVLDDSNSVNWIVQIYSGQIIKLPKKYVRIATREDLETQYNEHSKYSNTHFTPTHFENVYQSIFLEALIYAYNFIFLYIREIDQCLIFLM